MKENEKSHIYDMASDQTEFKRDLGLFSGVNILGGIMVGSGIFYLGSYVLQRVGMQPKWALLAWIIGGLISMLGGLCFAELGAALPKAGGSTVYLNEAYHPVVGFMSGFTSWLLSGAGSISAIAVAFASMLSSFASLSDMTIKLIAISCIILLTLLNYRGVKLGSIFQNVSMIAKLIPILIILFLGLILGKENPGTIFTYVPEEPSVSFGKLVGMISFAVLATLWAYEGWTNLNCVAEEIKEPSKNLPRAIILAIGGITVLYTLFNFAIYRVIPMPEAVSMIQNKQLYLGTEVAQRLMGNFGGTLVTIGMVISMLGALNGCILAFPRTYYAMAKEGHFFKSFTKLHPQYKTPTWPLIVQACIASGLIMLRNLDQLTSLVVFSGMIFNLLIVFAVLVLRWKYPDLKRPYKVFGGRFSIFLAIIIYLGLMVNTFIEDPMTSIIGLCVPALGAAVYFVFDQLKKA